VKAKSCATADGPLACRRVQGHESRTRLGKSEDWGDARWKLAGIAEAQTQVCGAHQLGATDAGRLPLYARPMSRSTVCR
jgi:hypothetical protein